MMARSSFLDACPGCRPRRALALLRLSRSVVTPLPHRAFATAMHGDDFKNTSGGGAGADETSGRSRSDNNDNSHSHAAATHVWPTTPHPTPYEVLGHKKGATYHKKRFYALAKHYHPDLHHNAPDHVRGLPTHVLVERYRLIVAANDLLSNPERRELYDLCGIGWVHPCGTRHAPEDLRTADRNWRSHPHSAARNATWEDWERWRQQTGMDPTPGASAAQEEVFMSNGGFAVVVLLFVFVGAWAQIVRVDNTAATILALRDEHHQQIADSLRENQLAIAGLGRQDRVDSFLERREGWDYETSSSIRSGHMIFGDGTVVQADSGR